MESVLAALALPSSARTTAFLISLVSATLLPLAPSWRCSAWSSSTLHCSGWPSSWPPLAATRWRGHLVVDGYGAEVAYEHFGIAAPKPMHCAGSALRPAACLLSWLPAVGDPLCAVAGWLKFPFWPCGLHGREAKFARYVTMTAALLWVFPGQFTVG